MSEVAPNVMVKVSETVSIKWLRERTVHAVFATPAEALAIRDALNEIYPVEAK